MGAGNKTELLTHIIYILARQALAKRQAEVTRNEV